MEKMHVQGAKESRNLIHGMKQTVQYSQSGQKEPHKANVFQEAAFRKKGIATLRTRCSQTSQPLWNEVTIAVQPGMIG